MGFREYETSLIMKKKVFVFSDSYWSINRVYRDVEKQLSDDFEFFYMHWRDYSVDEFIRRYNECDLCLTNVICVKCPMPDFPFLNFKKCLFVSHGFPENDKLTDYPTNYMYGMTSDSVIELFPKNVPVLYTPNGVDPDNFEYREKSGVISTIGWAGATYQPYKQIDWAKQISAGVDLPLKIGEGLRFEQMKDWYHTVDIVLVTTIPEHWRETGPLPAYEAIVSGVLVVGTPVGNFRKIPGPKFSTIEEGIQIVKKLKENPDVVKELAREQYRYVMENFTYKVISHYWRSAFYATIR
jgi:glycosyltransferase involved in cell wall biosynthesis